MTKKHIHCDVIKAWADGEEVEYKHPDDACWHKASTPNWDVNIQYRVKPKPVTKWYRVALFKKGNDDYLLFVSGNDFLEKNYESQKNFVRWVTERQYVEI